MSHTNKDDGMEVGKKIFWLNVKSFMFTLNVCLPLHDDIINKRGYLIFNKFMIHFIIGSSIN